MPVSCYFSALENLFAKCHHTNTKAAVFDFFWACCTHTRFAFCTFSALNHDSLYNTEHNHFLGILGEAAPSHADNKSRIKLHWVQRLADLCCSDCCTLCPLHVLSNWFSLSWMHCKNKFAHYGFKC